MMTEIAEQVRQLAEAAGASHARVVDARALEVHESVRRNCEVNSCGKYGRNWTCPPAPLAVCAERLRSYQAGVLLQNITRLEDSWDFEGMTAAALEHNRMVRAVAAQMTAHLPGYQVLPLGCGGCDFCERCTCPEAPCRFPEQAMASVESYGMDIMRLVESYGLSYINGVDTVSYVGMVLYCEP